jgi:L-ornithine Nalpha-acyltransferase
VVCSVSAAFAGFGAFAGESRERRTIFRARPRGVIEGAVVTPGNPPADAPGASGGTPIIDIRSGPLQVRLAQSEADIDAAQALRYRVFYETLGARAAVETQRRRRDVDRFDELCDHLLVLDHSRGIGPEIVVGTYRLIRREAASRLGGFYSAGEFEIARLIAYPGEILELGRSCVDSAYRQRSAAQLLWSGIAAYVLHYNIDLMFGCASLPGTDPDSLAVPLSYLYHYHLAAPSLRPRALPDRYVEMCRLPRSVLDPARALSGLPPLIKGYLRLGGFVGDGAVIDYDFNTTDVCIVVKTDLVTEKYSRHYVRAKDSRESLVRAEWAS